MKRKLVVFREHGGAWIVEEYVGDKILFAWKCDSKEEMLKVVDSVDFSAPLRLWSPYLGRTFTCYRWLEGTGEWWILFSDGKIWGVQAPNADTAIKKLEKPVDFCISGDIQKASP